MQLKNMGVKKTLTLFIICIVLFLNIFLVNSYADTTNDINLPEEITVTYGETLTLNPSKSDGRWSWDINYVSSNFSEGAKFTAINIGQTEIVYSINDQKYTVKVNIIEENNTQTAVVDQASHNDRIINVSTGSSDFLHSIIIILVGISMLVSALFLRKTSVERE